ncbi:MAG: phage tail protein [Limimaricola soesokkakensis]|uniref:phage tail protein n=1 Tax=Limimaricola soesokkakensis TaxID=1343159 RepID=UPI0040584A58
MAFFTSIAAAFTTAGAWFAGLSALGQFAVQMGVSLALNALSSAIAGQDKPKAPGIAGEVRQGADVPRSFILGRYATRGSLVYRNAWGKPGDTPNEFYTRVTALSDLPVKGLVEVWIDGRRCTLDLANPHPDGRGYPVVELEVTRDSTTLTRSGDQVQIADSQELKGRAWVKFYDGTQTAADPFLVGEVASAERPWTTAEVGTGVAYAITTFDFDRELFQGFPDLLFVLDGIEILDPDTGQTGTADDIPAAQAYAILSGLTYGGAWLYGPQGGGAGRVRASEWAAPVAACKAPVPGAPASTAERQAMFGSDTVPARYRSGYEVQVDQAPADVLGDLLAACAGRLAEVGTRYQMQVGDPAAAALTITDEDIISTQGQEFVPFLGIAESVNGVSATYMEPAEGWAVQNAPPYYSAEHEAEDGGRRLLTDVSLAAVPYREQVQRLVASVLREARRARRHSFTLPPRFVDLLPLDHVAWNSTRNGYVGKLMRVDGVVPLPDGNVQVDLSEVDPADYGWTASTDYQAVTAGSVLPAVVPAETVAGFQANAISARDGAGAARRAGVQLEWIGRDVEGARGLAWQIRLAADGSLAASGVAADYEAGAAVVWDGILPNEDYEARARYLVRGRRSPWTAWAAVTAGAGRLVAQDLDPDLAVPRKVAALPATDTGDQYLVYQGKLHEWDAAGGAWVKIAIDTDQLAGMIQDAQISGVEADKITGQIVGAQIAGLDAAKVGGQLADTQIAAIAAGKITGKVTSAQVDSILAAQISDDIPDGKIAGLSAGKLIGQVVEAQIASLPTAKLTGQITETQITDDAITAPKIKAGAIQTDALAVGSASNLLHNTNFYAGVSGWDLGATAGYTFGVRSYKAAEGTAWCKPGGPVLQISEGAPSGGYTDLRNRRVDDGDGTNTLGVPCEPGKTYECSAQLSVHRCTAQVRIEWRRADGLTAGYTTPGSSSTMGPTGSSANPDLWPRIVTRGVAPSDATHAVLHIRKLDTNTGEPDSYLFVYKPLLTEVPANATEPAPYVPGGYSLITGDTILTRSIRADNIAAGTITAAEIEGGTITGDLIAGTTILGDHLASNSVSTDKLEARAITAEKLAVTDLSKVVSETFRDASALSKDWLKTTGGASGAILDDAASAMGGRIFRAGDNSGDDEYWGTHKKRVPIDPDKIYRMRVRARRLAGAGGAYFGVTCFTRDMETPIAKDGTVGTYAAAHYFVASNVVLPSSYAEYVGYIKRGGSGNQSGDSPENAYAFTADAEYFSAMMLVNYKDQAGQTDVDFLEIEAMSGATLIEPNAITTEHLSAGSVKAAQIDAGEVNASHIATGAITTAKLAVGSAHNMLHNSGFYAALSGWSWGASGGNVTTVSIRSHPASWTKPGSPVLSVFESGVTGTASAYTDVVCKRVDGVNSGESAIPCEPGKMYEVSAYVSAHRCDVELRIEFRPEGGGSSTYFGTDTNAGQASDGVNPDKWPRLVVRGRAPDDASHVRIHIRKKRTWSGQANSYAFIYHPQLCEVPDNASEAVPYAPGGFTMVTGDEIVTGSIKAGHIDARQITAAHIEGGTITANELDSNSVTAAKINVTDLSAISANLGTIKVDTANIEDLAVDTIKVAGRAISNYSYNYYSGTKSTGSLTQVCNATLTNAVDNKVHIHVSLELAVASSRRFTLYIRRDGTTVYSAATYWQESAGEGGGIMSASFVADATPGVAHSWTAEIGSVSGGTASNRFMSVTELKK